MFSIAALVPGPWPELTLAMMGPELSGEMPKETATSFEQKKERMGSEGLRRQIQAFLRFRETPQTSGLETLSSNSVPHCRVLAPSSGRNGHHFSKLHQESWDLGPLPSAVGRVEPPRQVPDPEQNYGAPGTGLQPRSLPQPVGVPPILPQIPDNS